MRSPHESAKINKRLESVTYEKVDKALLIWLRQKVALLNIRIRGDMLLARANQFAERLGYDSRVCMTWIKQFQKWHNIKQVSKCGEEAGVNEQDVDVWSAGKVMDILQRYRPKDIFSGDET